VPFVLNSPTNFEQGGSGDGQDQQCRIVLPVVVAEIAGGFQDFGLELVGGSGGVLLQQGHQSLFSKLFFVGIAGFGNTVGKQNDAIAWFETYHPQRKLLVRKDAEDAATLG
jgi:hypothetical protein